ncbi:MAG: branched-chain amino acid ABC transporter permease [Xanthobacteraceae bacterium]
MSLEQVEQLAVAGIINGSFYALVGAGFGLILGVTGRFHYAFALVFTLAAYITSVLETPAGLPAPLAIAGGLLAAVILGVAIEHIVYRPLARASGALSLLTIFISSLGLTIAGINLITLAWTAFSRSIELVPLQPLNLGAVSFTSIDATLVVVSWLLIAALSGLLSFSDLGRSIRAARGNPHLARILGLDPDAIYLSVFALGSLLCGAAGILDGARFAVQPSMGIRPVMFAFVVAFLGGTRSGPIVVGLAGLFIGLVESLSGLFVSPQWSSLVVFSVLFVYLVLRPIDFRALRSGALSAAPSPRR